MNTSLSPSKENAPKLLVIDDDEGVTDLIESISKDLKFAVNCIYDYESIGNTYRSFQPDIIFLDLKLPGYDGVEVLHYLAEVGCKSKIILISGVDKTTLQSAGEVGRLNHLNIVGTLNKPFMVEDVEKALLDQADVASRFSSAAFQDLLGAGEFRLLCQPCMAIKTLAGQGLSGVDISINWYGQAGSSFYNEDRYLPFLEKANLITEYSHTVLDMAIEHFKSWSSRGMDMGIAIRLYDSMFNDNLLPGYALNLCRKHDIEPESITLVISESEVLAGSTAVLDVLTRLRINGFNVSAQISNPDTSELERLLHLPINELRLSSSLVSRIPGRVEDEFNVSTLISMCNKRNMMTHAEGIDDEATLKFLYDSGCTSGMGTYFSDPLKIHDFESFVSRGVDRGAALAS